MYFNEKANLSDAIYIVFFIARNNNIFKIFNTTHDAFTPSGFTCTMIQSEIYGRDAYKQIFPFTAKHETRLTTLVRLLIPDWVKIKLICENENVCQFRIFFLRKIKAAKVQLI